MIHPLDYLGVAPRIAECKARADIFSGFGHKILDMLEGEGTVHGM